MTRTICRILSLIALVANMAPCISKAEANATPKPALYSISKLDELRFNRINEPVVGTFLKQADSMSVKSPVSVIGKAHSYSANPHDYCSIAPYSWPNENNLGGPYVTKDGKTTPERNKYDRPKLEELANRLQTFSVAYYISRNPKYYDAFVKNIKAWFVDEGTYMTPNFEYAQVVKGLSGNKGQSYGICELDLFVPILESIFLLNEIKKIDKTLYKEIEEWFALFLDWILESKQWATISRTNNNIVSGCYVAIVEMARFTGNRRLVKRMSNSYTERILNIQIENDGRQPAELSRTIGYGYSVGNLRLIVDFALIMEKTGVKYYKKNQKRIDAAFSYLLQFVDNHDAFPYKQEASWEVYENRLKVNATRLQRLSSSKSSVKNNPLTRQSYNLTNVLDYVY